MKTPKIFRKRYDEKGFKKLLKALQLSEEKETLQKLLPQDEEGLYTLIDPLNKEEEKQVKSLAKAIKKNLKMTLNLPRIIVIVVIFGGIFGGIYFLKDIFLKRGIERGLEAVFQAKVDVEGVRLKILKGNLYLRRLAVTNRSSPMENLFEISHIDFNINLWPLVSKKVVIENIQAQEIQWNTERKSSGELKRYKSTPTQEHSEKEAVPDGDSEPEKSLELPDIASLFDGEALASQELANLQTLRLAEEVKTFFQGAIPERERAVSGIKEQGVEFEQQFNRSKNKTEELLNRNIGDHNDLLKLISDVNDLRLSFDPLYKKANTLWSESTALYRDAESDFRYAREAVAQINRSVRADKAYLAERVKGVIDMDIEEVLQGYAEQLAYRYMGNLMAKYDKVQFYRDRLKTLSGDKKREQKVRREGTIVSYPSKHYPKFHLQRIDISFGERTGDYFYELLIKDITTEPDLLNRPILLTFESFFDQKHLNIEGIVDLRSAADILLFASVQGKDFPLFLKDEKAQAVNITSYSGLLNTSVEVYYTPEGSYTLSGNLTAHTPKVEEGGETHEIATIFSNVIKNNNIEAEFSYNSERKMELSLNIIPLINRELQNYIRQKMDEIRKELIKQGNAMLDEQLAEIRSLGEEFSVIEKEFKSITTQLGSQTESISSIEKELDRHIKKNEDRIKEETTKQAEEAIKEQAGSVLKQFF